MSTAQASFPGNIDIRPLTGALGAEIFGIDVRKADEATFDLIQKAFLEYSVLVFRDQELDEDEFAAFGQRFGKLEEEPFLPNKSETPGVYYFFGAPKEHRYSLPSTRYLIHQPSGGAGGQASDIRIEAQEILKIRKRINELISRETGQTVEKVAKDSERNFWMSAEEAKDYGLVTKVITSASEIG